MARERRSTFVNSGQRMMQLSVDEVVVEQHDRCRDNIVSMTWGPRITANPNSLQRSINKDVNENYVNPPAMTKGQRSVNHVRRNGQNSLVTDLQWDQNIDDEVYEQHVDPQDGVVNEQHVDPPGTSGR